MNQTYVDFHKHARLLLMAAKKECIGKRSLKQEK